MLKAIVRANFKWSMLKFVEKCTRTGHTWKSSAIFRYFAKKYRNSQTHRRQTGDLYIGILHNQKYFNRGPYSELCARGERRTMSQQTAASLTWDSVAASFLKKIFVDTCVLAILAFCSDYIDNIEMKNWACTNIDALYKRMNVDAPMNRWTCWACWELCFRKLWLLWLCVGIVFFRFCFQAHVVFQDWIDRDFCFPKIMIMRCYCFLWYEEYEEYEELISS